MMTSKILADHLERKSDVMSTRVIDRTVIDLSTIVAFYSATKLTLRAFMHIYHIGIVCSRPTCSRLQLAAMYTYE